MVGGDAAGDGAEAAVCEREILRAADHVRPHPGCGVAGHDLAAGFAQAPGDVAAAGRDVENGPPGRPLCKQLEIAPLPVRLALAV